MLRLPQALKRNKVVGTLRCAVTEQNRLADGTRSVPATFANGTRRVPATLVQRVKHHPAEQFRIKVLAFRRHSLASEADRFDIAAPRRHH